MQLPPTLVAAGGDVSAPSGHAGDLCKTLFSRLAASGMEPVLLKRQYRCHPVLGSLASEMFYEGRLVNGVNDEDRKPLIATKVEDRYEWPPLVFFDLPSGREVVQEGGSFVNSEEANYVVWLVKKLMREGLEPKQIGCICLYKAQVAQIQVLLAGDGGDGQGQASGIQVSTVDAFQGGEKDVILVSSCRTQGLGFITSPNRMNVAITRARRHLVVIGCGKTLPQSELWRSILDRAATLPGGKIAAREFRMSDPTIEILSNEEEEAKLPWTPEERTPEDAPNEAMNLCEASSIDSGNTSLQKEENLGNSISLAPIMSSGCEAAEDEKRMQPPAVPDLDADPGHDSPVPSELGISCDETIENENSPQDPDRGGADSHAHRESEKQVLSQARTVRAMDRRSVIPSFDLGSSSDED